MNCGICNQEMEHINDIGLRCMNCDLDQESTKKVEDIREHLMIEELFLVWYTDSYGETSLLAVTDNPEKWLADENEETGSEDELEDFYIQEVSYGADLAIYGGRA